VVAAALGPEQRTAHQHIEEIFGEFLAIDTALARLQPATCA
jgi:hypothetical protein